MAKESAYDKRNVRVLDRHREKCVIRSSEWRKKGREVKLSHRDSFGVLQTYLISQHHRQRQLSGSNQQQDAVQHPVSLSVQYLRYNSNNKILYSLESVPVLLQIVSIIGNSTTQCICMLIANLHSWVLRHNQHIAEHIEHARRE